MCADISKYALKNQCIQFLYEKTTKHIFFYDNFGILKVFESNSAPENSFLD